MSPGVEIPLPRAFPDVIALGAFLKNTLCTITGKRARVSPVVGNLDCAENIARFDDTLAAMRDGLQPRRIAHDLHPDFHSTRVALASDVPALAVQHHHAHVAAVCAERGLEEPVIGLSLDGFGLGPSGEAWGGELLFVSGAQFERVGHLRPLLQPGGDTAAREPWRMAAAVLHVLGRSDEIATRFPKQRAAPLLGKVMERGLNCPPTSSCGRLFDAACGLLGIHLVAQFEGQAPIALERMVRQPAVLDGGWQIRDGVLDVLPLLDELSRCQAEQGADLFHGTLIAAMGEWAAGAAARHDVRHVVVGGGCFHNRVLAAGLDESLRRRGLEPARARALSPGDDGLSLGQAWIAALAAEGAPVHDCGSEEQR